MMKVKWHKNTPEDQPESGKNLWAYIPTVGSQFWSSDYEHTPVTSMLATYWAYAELPEPPEVSDVEED